MEEASGQPEVWPDNLQAVNMFISMSTQWRVGFSGATGLDYTALQAVMSVFDVPRSEWPELFDAIRILEDAALATMRKFK